MSLFKNKKKYLIFFIIIFFAVFIYLFFTVSNIVRDGYDRQNKIIVFVKSVISPHYIKKIKDSLFIVSNLKAKNEILELQVRKYEQGNEGQNFLSKQIDLGDIKYNANFFFLPFKKLDTNLGWKAETNSLRAHYSKIYNDNFFSISGDGKLVYSNKKNLLTNSLRFKSLPNNISQILEQINSELVGIRDLFFFRDQIYISMMVKNKDGITINLYRANLNFEEINFELFFETNESWKKYNVFSGGRIEKFLDNKILFSVGFSKNYDAPQDKKSLLGKIISIDIDTGEHDLISYGHRNPQGLFYYDKKNLVVNTEHGPKGGDEINFNFLDFKEDKNFGWPKVSYGQAYPGEENLFNINTFKKTHQELGFIEPFKYYEPSIGISEIIFLEKSSFCKSKCFLVSSLRANSLYIINIDDDFKRLLSEKRIHLKGNRIRDLDYDKDLDLIVLLSENIPSIITLKAN